MRNIKHFFTLLLSMLTATGLCLTFNSCQPQGFEDRSDFKLYYVGVTDIAVSQQPRQPIKPYWNNGTPGNFQITEIKFEGDPVVLGDIFTIDSETGVLKIGKTDDLRLGQYGISVSCEANGKTYSFPDAIVFNLMKTVPDAIRCEPEKLTVTLANVQAEYPEDILPTARIIAEDGAIRITGYSISCVTRDGNVVEDFDKFFEVSSESDETVGGVVSIKGFNKDFLPGKYVFDFKITTAMVDKDSEEGLFTDALTIDIISAPVALEYTPADFNIEKGLAASTAAPVLGGSLDGVEYSIAKITKDGSEVQLGDKITIDAKTGAVSVAENEFAEGDVYSVSVKVKNVYGEKTFDDILTINVVGEIVAVGEFSYLPLEKVENARIEHRPVAEVAGDDLKFSFVGLPDYLADLKIDEATGVITSPHRNKLPIGHHVITVKAENTKSAVETKFLLNIKKNPNSFTYVYWGTNLKWENGTALTKDEVQGISQFRYENAPLTCNIVDSDIPEGKKVSYMIGNYGVPIVNSGSDHAIVSINQENGSISFTIGKKPSRELIIQKVTVTVGEGDEAWVSEFPVFFNFTFDNVKQGDGTDGICTVKYTPFVVGIHPNRGGNIKAPVLKRVDTEAPDAKITMDYRSDFAYINLNGPESHGPNGTLDKSENLLSSLLNAYKTEVPTSKAGPANRILFSAFEEANYVNIKPLYVNTADNSVTVNGRIWRNDDGLANGIFVGKTSVSATKADPQNGGRHASVAIWFDDKF